MIRPHPVTGLRKPHLPLTYLPRAYTFWGYNLPIRLATALKLTSPNMRLVRIRRVVTRFKRGFFPENCLHILAVVGGVKILFVNSPVDGVTVCNAVFPKAPPVMLARDKFCRCFCGLNQNLALL